MFRNDSHRPTRTPGPSNVVAREGERSQLARLLDELEEQRGRLCLLSGEAGIGKTTLIEDFMQEAKRRDHVVCAGHCYDFLSRSPYTAWVSILRELNLVTKHETEHVEELLTSSERTENLPVQEHPHSAVTRLLTNIAREKPPVLVIEDIHWADQASLDLLRFATRHPVEYTILVVATYRDTEIGQDSYLYQLLPALIRDSQAELIELRRLSEASIRDFVGRLYHLPAGDIARLTAFTFRLAQGNPLFTCELLRSLERDDLLVERGDGWALGNLDNLRVPPLIRQTIDHRLSKLSDRVHHGLGVAAVIGEIVPFSLWHSSSGIPENELADITHEAMQASILIEAPRDSEFRFSHELVREAIYQNLSIPQRRSVHQKIGELLAADPVSDPGAVASHFREAGDDRAAGWHLRAGVHAHALYAPHDAVVHLNHAMTGSGHLSIDEQRLAHATRARSFTLIGEFDRARFDLESSLKLARSQGNTHAEWEATIELGMLWAERDCNRNYAYLRDSLDLAQTTGDPVTVGKSLNRIGNWYLNNEEPSRAETHHREALQRFTMVSDQGGIADTLDLLGLTQYMGGNLPQSAANLREAISLFRNLDRRQGLSSSLVNLMVCAGSHETVTMLPASIEPDEALGSGQEAITIARDIGWRAGESYALSHLASYLATRGDYHRAQEAAELAKRIAVEIDHREWICASDLTLGWIYLDLHQVSRARAHVEQSRAIGRELDSMFWYRSATAALARVHLYLGDAYRARAILDECLPPNDAMETIAERSCWLVYADLALISGDGEASLNIVDRLINTAVGLGAGDVIPALWKSRADALLRIHQIDEAIELLQLARDRAATLDWPILVFSIDTVYARALLQRNDVQAASSVVHDAQNVIQRIAGQIPDGAARNSFLQEARSQLPAISRQRISHTRFQPLDLTPRETEILRLVASGKTDREIADQLSISPRTVTNHVSNIFNKLGVNSRAAATAQAIRSELI